MVLSSSSSLRVRFVTKHVEFSVGDSPFAVPVSLGRRGLNEVVNHLLNRSEVPQAFDFLVFGVIVRSTLLKIVTQLNLSTEDILDIEYFPAIGLSDKSNNVELPSWIGALHLANADPNIFGVAGCYDGTLKLFDTKSLEISSSIQAHSDPIRAVTSLNLSRQRFIVSASKDQTIRLWNINDGCLLHNSHLLSGHVNSVESLGVWKGNQTDFELVLSGDWSGNLFAWKPHIEENINQPAKKRKDGKGSIAVASCTSVKPIFSLKSHQQSITSIIEMDGSAHAFTASWDHAIKEWDLEKQDCVHSINCSKVITSIDSVINLLASSHTDGKVRIWDTRTKSNQGESTVSFGKTSNWISKVFWKQNSEQLFTAVDYSGNLVLWDLRSSIPLSISESCHKGKILCGTWVDTDGNSSVLTGGSDCCIKSTVVK